MSERLNHKIKALHRVFPYPQLDNNANSDYWRNRLLYILLLSFVFFGFIAYVPSVYLSMKVDLWSVAIIDTIVYTLLIVVAISRKISAINKIRIILGTIYFLGVLLILIIGPIGAGFIWLFVFPVLSGILLNFRAVVITTAINAISLLFMFIPIILKKPDFFGIIQYTPVIWLVNVANFVALNFAASASLAVIISKLDQSFKREKEYSDELIRQKEQLEIEKKRAEESDKLKSAFLANMSHEIRTPMNSILGFTNLMKRRKLSQEKLDGYVDIINSNGEYLMSLISDIIDISKIEANQLGVVRRPFNLNVCLREIYHSFATKAELQSLELNLHTPLQDDEAFFETDQFRITQVLNNLLSNAFKFTNDGEIEFGYEMKSSEIMFFVKDTGVGIPDDQLERIFIRFNQVEQTKILNRGGTGLGLAISKAIVEMLGGRIWAESKYQQGSSFYFIVPKLNKPE